VKFKKPAKFVSLLAPLLIFGFTISTISVPFYHFSGHVFGQTNEATSSADNKAKGRDKLKDRLSSVKLKVCEKREAAVQNRSTKLTARAENIQNRFDRIVEKVDTYYIDVLMLKGVEIENYNELLGNVEDNRRAVATKLGAAESTANNFTCEGEDPKGQIKQFRTDMRGVLAALNNYKKSVVNLIVAVRTKAKNVKEPVATESAQPATGSAEPN